MMKVIHSYWAYVVLIVLVYTVFNAVIGLMQKKEFTHKDFRLGLFTLITAHIQLLIGVVLYIYEGRFNNIGATMKVPEARLLSLEHPIMMLLAIVLITVGWSKHKKKVKSEAKFKTFAIFYGLALIFILAKIPWSNWI